MTQVTFYHFIIKVSFFIINSGCFERNIIYIDGHSNDEIPIDQIISLIDLSEHCEQSFKYECTLGKFKVEEIFLFSFENGLKYVFF